MNMKKFLFLFVFAFIGITSTYANNSARQDLELKSIYNTENINTNKSGDLSVEKISIATKKNGSKCTATVVIKSETTVVTMSATAATCADAWAAIKKVVDALVKA